MDGDGVQVGSLAHRLRLTQRKHGATRVGEHAVNGVIAPEILKGGASRGAEHDQTGMAFRGESQNLDGRIAVRDHRLDGGAAACAGFSCEYGAVRA